MGVMVYIYILLIPDMFKNNNVYDPNHHFVHKKIKHIFTFKNLLLLLAKNKDNQHSKYYLEFIHVHDLPR